MLGSVSAVKEDLAITFARHAFRTKYTNIPDDALEVTRKHILDQLATTIGGSTRPGAKELVELFKDWGGKPEATILAWGYKVPAHHAAQANSTMGHALDYDDCDDRTGEHAGAAVIPAALAAAELKGKVSGKDFITAVATGLDISYRLSLCHMPKTKIFGDGWWNTQLYGYIAAPATVGKILGLSEEQMLNAIGIAYQEASGNIQCINDGALTKRMGPGFASRAGIFAALLAQKGVRGAQETFEGPSGMFTVYLRNNIDRSVLTVDLGKKFIGVETGFKPYPTCRLNHPFIDAALTLVNEHALKSEDLREVTIFHGNRGRLNTEPTDVKRNPRNLVDAQFSIPWNVAIALVYGKVLIKDFTPEGIKDPSVFRMAQQISCKMDDNLTTGEAIEPAVVEVRTKDGRVFSKRVNFAYGHPQNPMDWDAFAAKLEDCASWAAKSISMGNLTKVVQMCKKLDEADDIRSLIQLLS